MGGVTVDDDDVFEVDGVDELYAIDPRDFVASRAELVKALKAGGEKTVAARVAKLSKPTVVAWAVNQIARRDADAIEHLLSVSAKLRDAQAQAVRGEDAAALRAASRERRELLSTLAEAAAKLAGATHRDAAAETLDAASLDEEWARVLRAGRLTQALEPSSGFGLADMPDPPPARARERATNGAPKLDERELRRATEDLASAESALEAAEDRVRRADRVLDAAMQELQLARVERDEARDRRDDARATLKKIREP